MGDQSAYRPLRPLLIGDEDRRGVTRCPVVLLLDVSGSMAGRPIDELNDGLRMLQQELDADSRARLAVEIAIVTFGDTVQIVNRFEPAANFNPVILEAHGGTPLGEGIGVGLDLLRQHKDHLAKGANSYYRPWFMIITDGAPTDNWISAGQRLREEEARNGLSVFAFGVDGADFSMLKQLSSYRPPIKLKGTRFKEFFQWLSSSLGSVSRSKAGTEATISNPTVGQDPWASVAT